MHAKQMKIIQIINFKSIKALDKKGKRIELRMLMCLPTN